MNLEPIAILAMYRICVNLRPSADYKKTHRLTHGFRINHRVGFLLECRNCIELLEPLIHRGNESLLDVLAWLTNLNKRSGEDPSGIKSSE